MRRIRIHLAYDGAAFHGWQVQPGLATIQGALEEILSGIEGAPVHVAGSGRTDAGVHALAQVAAFSLRNPIPAANLRRAVNRLLPPAIRVLSAEEVEPDFHPRFQATAKTYEYRIWRGERLLRREPQVSSDGQFRHSVRIDLWNRGLTVYEPYRAAAFSGAQESGFNGRHY